MLQGPLILITTIPHIFQTIEHNDHGAYPSYVTIYPEEDIAKWHEDQCFESNLLAVAVEEMYHDRIRAMQALETWEARCFKMRDKLEYLLEENERKGARIEELMETLYQIADDIECALTLIQLSNGK